MKLQFFALAAIASIATAQTTTTEGIIESLIGQGTSIAGSLISEGSSALASGSAGSIVSSVVSSISSDVASARSSASKAASTATSTGAAVPIGVPVAGGVIGFGLAILGML